jgi:hypothetical protein
MDEHAVRVRIRKSRAHPEMTHSGFGLAAYSIQPSAKTMKKQVIKLIADG